VKYNYFRFDSRHVAFSYRSMSADVGADSVESGDPGTAFGAACLSVVEREIQLLPV
jgi:hypothetical protein